MAKYSLYIAIFSTINVKANWILYMIPKKAFVVIWSNIRAEMTHLISQDNSFDYDLLDSIQTSNVKLWQSKLSSLQYIRFPFN